MNHILIYQFIYATGVVCLFRYQELQVDVHGTSRYSKANTLAWLTLSIELKERLIKNSIFNLHAF